MAGQARTEYSLRVSRRVSMPENTRHIGEKLPNSSKSHRAEKALKPPTTSAIEKHSSVKTRAAAARIASGDVVERQTSSRRRESVSGEMRPATMESEEARITRKRRVAEVAEVDDGTMKNNDYCEACGGYGEFICCDGCPRVFHFVCTEPPLEKRKLPPGNWYCKACKATMNPARLRHCGVFSSLISLLEVNNPTAFSLPRKLKESAVRARKNPKSKIRSHEIRFCFCFSDTQSVANGTPHRNLTMSVQAGFTPTNGKARNYAGDVRNQQYLANRKESRPPSHVAKANYLSAEAGGGQYADKASARPWTVGYRLPEEFVKFEFLETAKRRRIGRDITEPRLAQSTAHETVRQSERPSHHILALLKCPTSARAKSAQHRRQAHNKMGCSSCWKLPRYATIDRPHTATGIRPFQNRHLYGNVPGYIRQEQMTMAQSAAYPSPSSILWHQTPQRYVKC